MQTDSVEDSGAAHLALEHPAARAAEARVVPVLTPRSAPDPTSAGLEGVSAIGAAAEDVPPAARAAGGTDLAGAAPAERIPPPSRGRRAAAQAVLLLAFGLDTLLYSLVVPFLPSRAQAEGAGPGVTGALFAAYAAGLLLATPFAGWATDRFGPRRTLLAGLGAMVAATLLFAFVPGLAALFAARAAQGAAGAITWTAGLALVAQLYDAQARLAVFARAFAATGIGTLLGPPLGGALYTWGGFRAPFLAAAGLALLDGLGRIVALPDLAAKPAGGSRPGEGARRAPPLRRPGVRLGLFGTLVGGAVLACLEPALPPLLITRFAFRPLTVGLLFGGLTVIFLALQPGVGALLRAHGARRLLLIGLALDGAALAALGTGVAGSLPLTLAALALLAAGTALALLPAFALLESGVAADGGAATGALYAAYNLAYAVGLLLGPLGVGLAVGQLGPPAGIAAMSLAPLVAGALILVVPADRRRTLAP